MSPAVIAGSSAVVQVRPRGAKSRGEGGRRRKESDLLWKNRGTMRRGVVVPSEGGVMSRRKTRPSDGRLQRGIGRTPGALVDWVHDENIVLLPPLARPFIFATLAWR